LKKPSAALAVRNSRSRSSTSLVSSVVDLRRWATISVLVPQMSAASRAALSV
jgi:hypothetical protein